VIFYTFALSEELSEKYGSQEVASNKLEKGPFRDYETAFCSLLALTVLERKISKKIKLFLSFSLFLFGNYSKFQNRMNKF
jgi:hypothetical protein